MTLPAIDDFSTFAGILEDYTEVIDPTTDLPALASNQVRADVAGMTRICPRVITIWSNDTATGTVITFESVVGNSASYQPAISKLGVGLWRLTFTVNVDDFLGGSQAWNLRWGDGCMLSSTLGHVQVVRFTPNILDVSLFDGAGSASDLAGQSILVRGF